MNNHFAMNAVFDPALLTLDDALVKFFERKEIPDARKARVKAAVAKTSRLLGRPANELPAKASYLIRQINRFKPLPGSPKSKTIANTKSEIRYLLRQIVGRERRGDFLPLTTEWSALRKSIIEPHILWKLSRFIAYCSGRGIEPSSVDDEVVRQFRAGLIESREANQPEQHVRAAVKAWNRASRLFPGWPSTILTLAPQRRKRWTIEPAKFPKAFNLDVDRWLKRLSHPDPLAEDGPPRPVRSTTINHRSHQIYKAASALVESGFAIELLTSLEIMVRPENFQAALQSLLDRQDGKTSEALFGLAGALKAVARQHVKAPSGQLESLRRMAAGLKPQQTGLGRRTEERLEPFEDEQVLSNLLCLPYQLVSEVEQGHIKPRYARVSAQVAIAIEIELFAPLRLKNVVHLNLNEHIQKIRNKGRKLWIIRIDRKETKNSSALTYSLPAESVALIERAMRFYDQTGGWLFPGRSEGPKTEASLSGQVKRAVESRLNIKFNMHLFRGLGAVLHLKENPNGFESVRAFLGDRDDQVIRQSYTRFAERHLISAAQETILKSRARAVGATFQSKHSKRRK